MRFVTTKENDILGPWIASRLGFQWYPGRGQCFGQIEDDKILAVVLFEDYNGVNCSMHVAASVTDKARWLTKEFLFACFDYPFRQLKCKRVTGLVPAKNMAARRFDEHLGFILEATLKDAWPDDNLLVYRMYREECRWLNLRTHSVNSGRHLHGRDSSLSVL